MAKSGAKWSKKAAKRKKDLQKKCYVTIINKNIRIFNIHR